MSNTVIANEIVEAIGAHGLWKMRLQSAIRTGHSEQSPAQAQCDDACRFGQWLYGPSIPARMKAELPYQVVRRLHREFHHSAGTVLHHAVKGRADEARVLMERDYLPRSEKLVRALNKWRRELEEA